ncbi:CHASE2 domain-containing protein [Methylobacter luteus]|jgi:CHASE2 domain-containing sensor protein|uniref:CHASE2 domain-containing protein n=1 Tax=Methylobacter luteus TaxID=415 RepID=UPI000414A2AF|nr:CHASE2 domain-containing protein [Methylobacter luteus]
MVDSIRTRWKTQKLFYRRLIFNLIIGLLCAVLLHSFDELPLLQQAEDDAIDWVMAMQLGTHPVQAVVPFALLDIDEAVYRNWGEPLLIPRDKLLDIIRFAVSGNPALIVVDVDLSRLGQCHDHDLALVDFLKEYHGQGKPPIILPQLFREPVEGESKRTLREPFFVRDLPSGSDTRVFLASPLFEVDENDFRLRRWRLWEIASNQEVIPSVELLTVALLRKPHDPSSAFQNVKQNIKRLDQAEAAPKPQHLINSTKIKIANMKFDKGAEGIGQRILYSIPWTLQPGEIYPDNFVRRSVLPITKKETSGNEQNPADQYSAQCTPSSKATAMAHLDSSWLKDQVVVIGASFKESRDIYATPIGQMPGAMVIVNAINSLYEHGPIKKPELYWIIPIEIVLIAIMSVAFAWFDSFLAMLISSITVIMIMLPLSFYLFKYGVWLNFVIPLFIVDLYEIYTSFEEYRARARAS